MKFTSTLVLLIFVARVNGQPPKPEEVRQVTAVTLSLHAGSFGQQSKRVTYSPPPGWYVRSHEVVCTTRRGPSSFAVSTVPADWLSTADERQSTSNRIAGDAAISTSTIPAGARLKYEAEQERHQAHADATSHHALVVEATAKGAGLFQGGGSLELIVVAELVRVGGP